ncbi:MAG TPA: hypothetical protein VF018_05870 [Acidobacteriaceae bacterium]
MNSPSEVHSPASSRSDSLSAGETDSSEISSWTAWLALLIIALVRIPFLLVHPLQEDAYITFRAARHLAENGDFSFNLHQHFPGTTSLLYPLIVAAIDLLLHPFMILGVQIFGTLCIAAASYLIAAALCSNQREQPAVWLLTACWPISLVMSYSGMETSLLALVLAAALFALARGSHWTLFAVSVLLLPLVRPDAVAYGLLFCAAMFFIDRRAALRGTLSLATGCGLFLLGTRVTTGQFLPATARAKEIAYHPSHSLAAVAARIHDLFLGQSFLLPTTSTYLVKLSPIVLIVVVAAFILAFHFAHSRRERIVLGTLAAATIAIPLAYAYGGVVFAWYLFPANWLAIAVTFAVAVRIVTKLRFRMAGAALLALIGIGLIFMQWTKAFVAATEDYHYRGDIGRYLGAVSHGQGTLFLEPAGLIPYFSGLRTDDEVGLVSSRVTDFMKQDPVAWWFDYVAGVQPDYIVQRQSFDHYRTFENYTLTPDQQRWFAAHYRLIRRVHYVPATYHSSHLLQRILAMGPLENYLVYERRDLLGDRTPGPQLH